MRPAGCVVSFRDFGVWAAAHLCHRFPRASLRPLLSLPNSNRMGTPCFCLRARSRGTQPRLCSEALLALDATNFPLVLASPRLLVTESKMSCCGWPCHTFVSTHRTSLLALRSPPLITEFGTFGPHSGPAALWPPRRLVGRPPAASPPVVLLWDACGRKE